MKKFNWRWTITDKFPLHNITFRTVTLDTYIIYITYNVNLQIDIKYSRAYGVGIKTAGY